MEKQNPILLLLKSSYFREFSNSYSDESILDIADVSKEEKIYSNFLYWLLDNTGNHNLGLMPLRLFIKTCLWQKISIIEKYQLSNNLDYFFPNDWFNLMFSEDLYDITNYEIHSNYFLKDIGIVDLFLSFSLIAHEGNNVKNKKLDMKFIIKNKINTVQYCEDISDDAKYIYLVSDIINKPCKDNFLPCLYIPFITKLINKCLQEPLSSKTNFILNSYLKAMTFSTTEKELNLVKYLWDYYSEGLKEIIMQKDIQSNVAYKTNKKVFDNIFYISINNKNNLTNLNKEDFIKMKNLINF